MKLIVSTLAVCLLTIPLLGGEPKEDQLPSKKDCIAVFKQVLNNINSNELKRAFSQIVDGGGSSFTLISARAIEDIKKEDGSNFVAKNFPNYDLMQKSFEKIEFSEVRKSGKKEYTLTKDRKTLGNVELFTISVKMTFLEASADNKKGIDGRRIYSHLKFVRFEKEIYWVPFGW